MLLNTDTVRIYLALISYGKAHSVLGRASIELGSLETLQARVWFGKYRSPPDQLRTFIPATKARVNIPVLWKRFSVGD